MSSCVYRKQNMNNRDDLFVENTAWCFVPKANIWTAKNQHPRNKHTQLQKNINTQHRIASKMRISVALLAALPDSVVSLVKYVYTGCALRAYDAVRASLLARLRRKAIDAILDRKTGFGTRMDEFMVTKPRFWKADQTFGNVVSKHFSHAWVLNLGYVPLKSLCSPNEEFYARKTTILDGLTTLRMRFWTSFQSVVAQKEHSHTWKVLQKCIRTLWRAKKSHFHASDEMRMKTSIRFGNNNKRHYFVIWMN